MSVDSVTRMWSNTSGNYTSEKFDQFDTNYSLQDGYMVVATQDTELPEVLAHPDMPKAGDQHPAGINAWVRGRTAQRQSPILWLVTISYEGFDLDLWSFSLEWTDSTSTEPIDRDIDGRAIVTECGEPIQGLTVEIADPVAIITRKFLFVNQYLIGAYRHATNSDTFLGWPPGTARLVGWSSSSKFKYGAQTELYDVTARFQFRYPFGGATEAQAWYKRWRHEGLYVKSGGVIQRARDPQGLEVSTPVLLKTDGTQETNPDNAVFKYTQVYGSLPFNALGLIG